MSEEIIKVLDDLAKRAGIAIDWTSENVLPYLIELGGILIKYELWMSVLLLVLGVLALSAFIFIVIKITKAEEINFIDDEVGFGIILFFLLASGIAIFATQIPDIIACITFPEKIIFEYLQGAASW